MAGRRVRRSRAGMPLRGPDEHVRSRAKRLGERLDRGERRGLQPTLDLAHVAAIEPRQVGQLLLGQTPPPPVFANDDAEPPMQGAGHAAMLDVSVAEGPRTLVLDAVDRHDRRARISQRIAVNAVDLVVGATLLVCHLRASKFALI